MSPLPSRRVAGKRNIVLGCGGASDGHPSELREQNVDKVCMGVEKFPKDSTVKSVWAFGVITVAVCFTVSLTSSPDVSAELADKLAAGG